MSGSGTALTEVASSGIGSGGIGEREWAQESEKQGSTIGFGSYQSQDTSQVSFASCDLNFTTCKMEVWKM